MFPATGTHCNTLWLWRSRLHSIASNLRAGSQQLFLSNKVVSR